jgi:hypothetical protein
MTIQFWINDPFILLNKKYIFELWPQTYMCYEQKINAISRLIILLTILGYILTNSIKILSVGVLTLLIIYILYITRREKQQNIKENFEVNISAPKPYEDKTYLNPVTLDNVLRSDFKQGNKRNPFSNVLLTQIEDEPDRKAAPPAFNVDVDEDITKNIKRSVQMMNPGIKNTNKQLFGDLWQRFELDQANRAYYSTANTRVTNDGMSFAQYLYGNMPSAKEDTPDGNMQRIKDNSEVRWIMI